MTTEDLNRRKNVLQGVIDMLNRLEVAGLIHAIDFVAYDGDIFMVPDADRAELIKEFAKFFKHAPKLNRYYMSHTHLALTYTVPGFEIVFFESNAEEVLADVSGGKCEIVDREVTTKGRCVVCNMESK